MSAPREPPASGPRTTLDEDLQTPPSASGEPQDLERRWRRLSLSLGETVRGTPYRLLRWLGDGGMGAVFEAQHVDTERHVAVKVLHAQRRSLGWVVEGFRNEARASARIGSPHIVDIYDFKELDDGRLLIAMEFLDGPTLQDQTMRGLLPWPRLVAVTRQICKGLAAAHRAGIVHRDIKPENIILVDRDGREDFVKLLDFGVAHFMREGGDTHMSGTAQYMAPEASEGSEGSNDTRVDIYSVGCLLYALVVGDPPFSGATPSDTLHKQRQELPMPPSQRAGREVPAELDALVLRCLAKDPADRFQTMDELEAAVCELQIEHGWSTVWDDLPAPPVEDQRRAKIEAGLRALAETPRRSSWWPAMLLGGMLAAASVAAIMWPTPETASLDENGIALHAQAAQKAAARFYFVYPPREDPGGSTAYREVLALEALDDAAATQRGTALRDEFAETLARLGDRYWDFEGARPFAYEYYASALVFADHERARARAGLSPVALEKLRQRAATGNFTEHELLALEPLLALAEPDPATRADKLEALRGKGGIPASLGSSLDRMLAAGPDHGPRITTATSDTATSDTAASDTATSDKGMLGETTTDTGMLGETTTGAPSEAADPGGPVAKPPEPASDDPDPPLQRQRDPAGARKLVLRAKSADAAGDRQSAETLYNRALEADSRNVDALDGLADIAFRRARYGECARKLERAVKLGPGDPERWLRLGDAYFKTLRYADARIAYQRARDLGSSAASGRLAKLDRKLGEAGGDAG